MQTEALLDWHPQEFEKKGQNWRGMGEVQVIKVRDMCMQACGIQLAQFLTNLDGLDVLSAYDANDIRFCLQYIVVVCILSVRLRWKECCFFYSCKNNLKS